MGRRCDVEHVVIELAFLWVHGPAGGRRAVDFGHEAVTEVDEPGPGK